MSRLIFPLLLVGFVLIGIASQSSITSSEEKSQGVKVHSLDWDCAGKRRANNLLDDSGRPFGIVTQEEYCEWTTEGDETRRDLVLDDDGLVDESSGPLSCRFRTSFDSSRQDWLPQRAPKRRRFRAIDEFVGLNIEGKMIHFVSPESGAEFLARIPEQSRMFWDTQFNTMPALDALVNDCLELGAVCEEIACVPERASDPLICRSVQALKHGDDFKCESIQLVDYTAPPAAPSGEDPLPQIPNKTANPAEFDTLAEQARLVLLIEIMKNVEWQARNSGVLQRDGFLPERYYRELGEYAERQNLIQAESVDSFPEYIDATTLNPIFASESKSDVDQLVVAVQRRFEGIAASVGNRFHEDTNFKLQLEIKPAMWSWCHQAVDPKLAEAQSDAKPDGTHVVCELSKDDGLDEAISSCDDIASHIKVVARVVTDGCEKPTSIRGRDGEETTLIELVKESLEGTRDPEALDAASVEKQLERLEKRSSNGWGSR